MDNATHMLCCLSEECSEIARECADVSVRVSKALRFGLEEVQPGQLLSNVRRIADELADLLAVAEELERAGIITRVQVEAKKGKLRKFMAYAEQCGSLTTGA